MIQIAIENAALDMTCGELIKSKNAERSLCVSVQEDGWWRTIRLCNAGSEK